MVFGPATGRPEERRVPHRRRGRPRHAGPRHQELLRHADRRRAARGVRAARRARAAGREQVAGRQDQAGLLQEGGRRHPAARPRRRSSTAPRRSRASTRSAPPAASTTSTRSCAAWWPATTARAALARTVLYETLIYSANRLGEIADDVRRHRPRAALGLRLGARPVRDLGRPGREGDRREDGGRRLHRPRLGARRRSAAQGEGTRFYRGHGRAPASWRSCGAARRLHADRRPTRAQLSLDAVRAAGGEVERNAQRLDPRSRRRRLLPRVPRQDERHRSRHRRDDDEGGRPRRARGRRRWSSATTRPTPSAPAPTCSALMVALGQGNYEAVGEMVTDFQDACHAHPLRAASRWWRRRSGWRWAAAPRWCSAARRVRAAAELYLGCVEVGVGLIPAGGGCMEMAARAGGARHRRSAVRPAVAAAGAVRDAGDGRASRPAPRRRATSATCAPGDSVSMARETLIADAKQTALGWRAPAIARPRRGGSGSSARPARPRCAPRCATWRGPTRSASTTPRSAATWRASCPAAPSRRAPRSASSTCSTSSARPSSRCAGNRRRATASNTC